jgi:hypothetical protein
MEQAIFDAWVYGAYMVLPAIMQIGASKYERTANLRERANTLMR